MTVIKKRDPPQYDTNPIKIFPIYNIVAITLIYCLYYYWALIVKEEMIIVMHPGRLLFAQMYNNNILIDSISDQRLS